MFFFTSHMTRKHITLWLGCMVCETCSKASSTMKLHKEVDHKNSELITNCTSFFNQRNRLIGEKMFATLRSTSSRRFLHHTKKLLIGQLNVQNRQKSSSSQPLPRQGNNKRSGVASKSQPSTAGGSTRALLDYNDPFKLREVVKKNLLLLDT